ncbi:AAA family ATPase [Erysipelothrix rhusiopathiae]|nr:AAA family ATPase [Erysipelothrix rhusiopathiae]MDE9421732.1 AAA family ATPase [Erysipelothrix rhusiopathiae]
MIQINGVKIQNFRSFKEKSDSSKFIDNTYINVLTGKNNSGKTNALRAIALFFEPQSYDEEKDMNAIKRITGGASKKPSIDITFLDNDTLKKEIKYTIRCDLNKEESKEYELRYIYKEKSYTSEEIEKIKTLFKSSKAIQNFIERRFKCVFLSTTDEDINTQADNAIKDMILQFYQQQNKDVKKSIENFQEEYESMVATFENNFKELEDNISKGFSAISSDNIKIIPRLNITKEMAITEFLLNNLSFTIDDSYDQVLGNKGAGIQRSSLILLNIFLLKNIYSNKNKIILLDEPESFLYPLLISKIKKSLEDAAVDVSNNLQIFLTTHSREFLTEIESEHYRYYNVEQEIFKQKYKRSPNEEDIVKKSNISDYNRSIKNKVLRNYGILNDIDDYEEVIICEGKTDMNYLEYILRNQDIVPQIRCNKNFTYNYIGRGGEGILPILFYLNEVSNIKRKVLVLLDGDREGKKIREKISKEQKNLQNIENIRILMHDDELEIEDVVYSNNNFVERVLSIFSKEFEGKEDKYREYVTNTYGNKSVIKKTDQFIKDYLININIMKIKYKLSLELHDKIIDGENLVTEINNFFA